jgi:predicted RNase H-like HicB family nuclease
MSPGREIHLVNDGEWWVARDIAAAVTAQGDTRDDALDTLDAVVEAVHGDGGHEPTDEEIRALGVDPETARTQGELPDVLQGSTEGLGDALAELAVDADVDSVEAVRDCREDE